VPDSASAFVKSGLSAPVTTISLTFVSTGLVKATSLRRSSVIVISPAAMSPSPASKASKSRSREVGIKATVRGREPSLKVLLTHASNNCAPSAAVP
jgi:hypothetical protein